MESKNAKWMKRCAYALVFAALFSCGTMAALSVEFGSGTPENGTGVGNTAVLVNVTITSGSMANATLGWNSSIFSLYDRELVLDYNFDNVSAIGEHYNGSNNSFLGDASLWASNGTAKGNISYTEAGRYGGALLFDGRDDVINATASGLSTAEGTVAVWIKPADTLNASSSFRGFVEYGSTQNNKEVRLGYTGGKIQFCAGSCNASAVYAQYTTNLSKDVWYYVAGTYSNATNVSKLYVNAVNVSSGLVYPFSPTGTLYVGRLGLYSSNNFYFNGTMDEIRVWNRSLSDAEIYQQYRSNVRKYGAETWGIQSSQANLSIADYQYYVNAKDTDGNENGTGTRTVKVVFSTAAYYDNRKAAVIFTADDWDGDADDYAGFMNASYYARKNGVVFSPGIVPDGVFKYSYPGLNSSQWAGIQEQVDAGYVSPVSHSLTHAGDSAHNYTSNGTTYDKEVNGSKVAILGNLTMPRQYWFNSSEYLVAYIDPYGYSDSTLRSTLASNYYLIERAISQGQTTWASWWTDGLYARISVTEDADANNISVLNSGFDDAYAAGGIYHFFIHPRSHFWEPDSRVPTHLDYIGNKSDVWYAGMNDIYSYRYLEDRIKPGIEVANYSNQTVIAAINASGSERNKYGLSYPLTYKLAVPTGWSNVFVHYGNGSAGAYAPMAKKKRGGLFQRG